MPDFLTCKIVNYGTFSMRKKNKNKNIDGKENIKRRDFKL